MPSYESTQTAAQMAREHRESRAVQAGFTAGFLVSGLLWLFVVALLWLLLS